MARKRTLLLVSALTILAGFYRIWSFFLPILDPTKPKVLDPVEVIVGTLLLLTGWGLFRRNEIALLFGFWVWFTSLIWSFFEAAIFLAQISSTVIGHNIFVIMLVLILLVAHLSVVIFLSQKGTKMLFVPSSAENIEATTEGDGDESMKNVESPE